jgi:hypothetical protein
MAQLWLERGCDLKRVMPLGSHLTQTDTTRPSMISCPQADLNRQNSKWVNTIGVALMACNSLMRMHVGVLESKTVQVEAVKPLTLCTYKIFEPL